MNNGLRSWHQRPRLAKACASTTGAKAITICILSRICLLLFADVVAAVPAEGDGNKIVPPTLRRLLDCEGAPFDPAWASFRQRLPSRLRLSLGSRITEPLASLASDLLDMAETVEYTQAVMLFGRALRGDAEAAADLGGYCLYGVVAAYTTVAIHVAGDGNFGGLDLPPTSASSLATAMVLLGKKLSMDFLEMSAWPVRSFDIVAAYAGWRNSRKELPKPMLPCFLSLHCDDFVASAAADLTRGTSGDRAQIAAWPSSIVAVGLHAATTLESVSALKGALADWNEVFQVQYAGHPCPPTSSERAVDGDDLRRCEQERCHLLGVCNEAADPLADLFAGALDVGGNGEEEVYRFAEVCAALKWSRRRLETLRLADLIVCTFPTVVCVAIHKALPEKPMLLVFTANPLFAAPGCKSNAGSLLRDCETDEAREYLDILRSMLVGEEQPSEGGDFVSGGSKRKGPIQALATYTAVAATVSFQTGVHVPLAAKAARYLPMEAYGSWQPVWANDVLVVRTRFLKTVFGANFRAILAAVIGDPPPLNFVYQQEAANHLFFDELVVFRAAVILPEDLALQTFTEFYSMAMPIFVPDRNLACRLQLFVPWDTVMYAGSRFEPHARGVLQLKSPIDSAADVGFELMYPPWFDAGSVPYELERAAFWYEFSEYASYSGVQHFQSVPALIVGLVGTDLVSVSNDMRLFSAKLWRRTRQVYGTAAASLAAFVVRMSPSGEKGWQGNARRARRTA
eukprot:TRINITY_DN9449_c0_g1_i2.p1 TRINITY_DN9449_c0_g1~~TRINITY_DN9449_c0_g1_i2.p1  ORF type:complete len:740 (+),score=94.55 TRINITY_DN9449_c0_g1_i2:389-2608(+)